MAEFASKGIVESEDARPKVLQLLGYLGRMAELRKKIFYDIAEYKGVAIYEDRFADLPGLSFSQTDSNGPVWIEIRRLNRTAPPEPAEEIASWLKIESKLIVEPEVIQSRLVTVSIAEAENYVEKGWVSEDMVSVNFKDKKLRDLDLRLEQLPDIRAGIDAYEIQWHEWARTERPRRNTIDIYDKLFSLQRSIESEGSEFPLEAVIGIGLARVRSQGGRQVNIPIIQQLVDLELDPETAAIRIRPREKNPEICLDPFIAMEMSGVEQVVNAAKAHFEQNDREDRFLSPFGPYSFSPILTSAAAHLSKNGHYMGHDRKGEERSFPSGISLPHIGEELLVTDTWVFFTRTRQEDYIRKDINAFTDGISDKLHPFRISNAITRFVEYAPGEAVEDEGLDLRAGLGRGFGTMFGGPSSNVGTEGLDPSDLSPNPEEAKAPAILETEGFFLPLPANEAQLEILRRLEIKDADGVLVQGPPGTGKSHTIANIISHYLATGRRVLVTSKAEPALAVLQDKLPQDIRAFTIGLLTNDREGLKQLEDAINLLAEDVSDVDLRKLASDINAQEGEIVRLKQRIAQTEVGIFRLGRLQLEEPPMELLSGIDERTAEALALWVREKRPTYSWFEDRPSPTGEGAPTISDIEMGMLRAARKNLGRDISCVGQKLPTPEQLPEAADLVAVHQDLLAEESLLDLGRSGKVAVMSTRSPNALERVKVLKEKIEELIRIRSHLRGEEKWADSLVEKWIHADGVPEQETLLGELRAELAELATARDVLRRRPVKAPADALFSKEVMNAVGRAAEGEKPFGLFALSKPKREARAAFEAILVEGHSPASSPDWSHVKAYMQWRRDITRFAVRWNEASSEEGLPHLEQNDQLQSKISTLNDAFTAIEQVVSGLSHSILNELPILFPRGLSVNDILKGDEEARNAVQQISLNLSREQYAKSQQDRSRWLESLSDCEGEISDAFRAFIGERVGRNETEHQELIHPWENLLAELRRVRALSPELSAVESVTAKIESNGAPIWSKRLRSVPVGGETDAVLPSNWRDAWRWARADAYLDQIDCRLRLEELSARRRRDSDALKVATENLVASRTRYGLARKIRSSGVIGAALQSFAQAVRRIGRGTGGVRTPRFRRQARESMEKCYEAIPCWIAPLWRVSEMLPSETEIFDLVIFDEASQCDITGALAVLRGKKVLIVGDDKQVSPNAEFTEERIIRQLRHTFLDGLPHADLMLPGISLYDLGGAMFPGTKIMLREHFRCVEPIIEWSQQFYTGPPNQKPIIPVRLPAASERLDPPLVDIYIPNGLKESKKNRAEAHAIVSEIKEIVSNPNLKDRSIGVVSLVGYEQASLINRMLLNELDERAVIQHRIECGDASTFQGKEKDIVFLSMVASPGQGRAVTGRTSEQRYNVAVSRARDRCYLVRSLRKEDLSNERDLKLKLIRHFESPLPAIDRGAADLLGLCESQFEKEVFLKLTGLGYAVTPQVRSGPFRIDLVVEGEKEERLAIELDGDRWHGPDKWAEDLARQQVLERVGWRFWRCFASTWWRVPEACLGDLVNTLREIGIGPASYGRRESAYTEHRVWREKAPELPSDFSESRAATVSPGDRVVVRYEGDNGRQYTIRFDDKRHDPENGIWRLDSGFAQSILGREEEETLEAETDQGPRTVTILQIEKNL